MIKWIFIIVIGLIFLGYIGFDVRKAVENPTTQSNLVYAKNVSIYVWNKYLETPIKYLWNEIFIKYIWTGIVNLINKKDLSSSISNTNLVSKLIGVLHNN